MDFEMIGSLNGFSTTVPVSVPKAVIEPKAEASAEVKPKKADIGISREPSKEVEGSSKGSERDESDKSLQFLDKVIHAANKKLLGAPSMLVYSVHKETKTVMIKIVDPESKEIIKEIPPEKNLDALAKMWELTGIMLDAQK